MADLNTRLASVVLPNPVLTASGCAAAGRELSQFFDVAELGAVVTKSVMPKPRSGRATPRMAETPSGMLNSIGLQGPGIEAFVREDLAWLAERGARVIVSIAGRHMDEFVAVAKKLIGHPAVSALEVNISCPNVEGQVFASDASASARVIGAVRRIADTRMPIFAKLTPDVTDITQIARACADSGADGFSLINTVLGMVIDTDTMAPALGGITGGLSGPAIRPVAVRCVWQVHRAIPFLPIIGMGGIRTGLDALQFVLAGASAVSVGTAIFADPSAPVRILGELDAALDERGFASLADATSGRPARRTRRPGWRQLGWRLRRRLSRRLRRRLRRCRRDLRPAAAGRAGPTRAAVCRHRPARRPAAGLGPQ
jgi:dihydroorotate dehydrogenase (NAD+) catalytic subunit